MYLTDTYSAFITHISAQSDQTASSKYFSESSNAQQPVVSAVVMMFYRVVLIDRASSSITLLACTLAGRYCAGKFITTHAAVA